MRRKKLVKIPNLYKFLMKHGNPYPGLRQAKDFSYPNTICELPPHREEPLYPQIRGHLNEEEFKKYVKKHSK